MTRIVVMSDTHSLHSEFKVPEGDIFIHAGDFCGISRPGDIIKFNAWLGTLPHKFKLVIAGNHDCLFEDDFKEATRYLTNCTYLQDDLLVAPEGFTVYGSPWQPEFNNWAFNLPRGRQLRDKWQKIPTGTQILITHGPPQGILDYYDGSHLGCEELAKAVQRVSPYLHIFGHIHEGYGVERVGNTLFVNASNLTGEYEPINSPIVIDMDSYGRTRLIRGGTEVPVLQRSWEEVKRQEAN